MTRVPERVVDESSAAKEAAAKEPTHFDTTDFSKFLQVPLFSTFAHCPLFEGHHYLLPLQLYICSPLN